MLRNLDLGDGSPASVEAGWGIGAASPGGYACPGSAPGWPLGVVTLHDLGFLERAVEDGHDAGGLMTA
jgi:hypothetical protein